MDGYLQIAIIIMVGGFASAIIYELVCSKKITHDIWPITCLFCLLYYFTLCCLRALTGHSSELLGHSFIGKSFGGYLKVVLVLVALLIVVVVIMKICKQKICDYVCNCGAFFMLFLQIYYVLVDVPTIGVVCSIGIAAIIGAIFFVLFRETKIIQYLEKDEISLKQKYQVIFSLMLAFSVFIFIEGPTEIYSNSVGDFVFSFNSFIWYMIVSSIVVTLFSTIVIGTYIKGLLFKLCCMITFVYIFCSYFQTLFLNRKLEEINGLQQMWSGRAIFVNVLVWIALIIITVYFLAKKPGMKLMKYGAWYIGAIQLVALVFTLFTSDILSAKSRQLVEDDMFTLSQENNVIVFILDAYDIQMLHMVLDDTPDYLEPLHDFTFYSNVTTRFAATDGSLPYLLTGIKEDPSLYDRETYLKKIYEESTFLSNIKSNNYDIRLLTEGQYVDHFGNGLIDNYVDDFYCELDFGKTISQMSDCVRYRGMPFLLKKLYQYENYDLSNLRMNTNLYLFGTDSDFYQKLQIQGITINNSYQGAFRMFHLYGAHSPYYLTENAELDYSSNKPIAQWKGCLKIVYEYLDELKKSNLYDSTTIIITADHGLNDSQRGALSNLNISVTEQANPIYFIKRRNETREKMDINCSGRTDESFCATILKSIDESNESYGKAIWEATNEE